MCVLVDERRLSSRNDYEIWLFLERKESWVDGLVMY